MASVKVRLYSPGVKKLLNDKKLGGQLESLAKKVEAQAKASAPVDTGNYRDSIYVYTTHTDRVVARVAASADYALEVESKTGNLSKALDAVGR